MTAKLHDRGLHVLSSQRCETLSDRHRAGKGDHPDGWLGDEKFGDIRRTSEDKIEHSCRKPCTLKRFGQQHGACRRFLGRFQNDRTTGRKRTADFAGRRTDRKIPRRERGNDANRLAQNGIPHPAFRGNDPSIQTASLGRIPLDHVAGALNLQSRLNKWLALLERHHARDLICPLPDDPRRFQHDVLPLHWRHLAPDRKALGGGSYGVVEIEPRRMRYVTKNAFVGRIDDGIAVPLPPFTADQQFNVGIALHANLSAQSIVPNHIRARM